jgi:hypothetical protein
MDVFVEVEKNNDTITTQVRRLAWKVGFYHYITIVPLLFTRDQLENSPLRAAPIVQNIMKEGVQI